MSIDRRRLIVSALLAAGFALMYWHVFAKLVHDWWTDDNYSHVFLIIPIALYLAWERRRAFADAPLRLSIFGLIVVIGSIAVLLAGILGAELFLTRISILGTVAGSVLFLFGWRRLRILAFPLAFLFLMIPLPAIIFNQIAFPLQLFASRVGELALTTVDIPVLREGNVLILANTSLEVAEACSGIRSLVSLLTLGIVFGYFADQRGWVRALIALSTIPIAVITNGARVAGTGVAAHQFGPGAAEGFLHEFSGWVIFVLAFMMIITLQWLLVRLVPPRTPAVPAVT